AERARRAGWRVVAFAFAGSGELGGVATRVVPSRLTEVGPVLEALSREGATAAVLCGRFSMGDVLRSEPADETTQGLAVRAGSRVDVKLVEAVIAMLASVGVEVLDQRAFLGDLLLSAGCWSRRAPTEAEWSEIRRGLVLARHMADQRIGQTVVLRRGAVTAVEAVEGTTEAIRRGTALGGAGAVVVKAVAGDHDYRIDTPAIGTDTIGAAATGGAAVLAVEAGRVLLLDRVAAIAAVDEAGLALVSVDGAA
ncbi:MAG: UDP-2,3-diacylglucosamine diphosphatase LpxI domain-containing protein, partial [Candidatus Rokuibacteriota bacterium]